METSVVAKIDATAVVEPGVELGLRVEVGPHAHVAAGACLEDDVRVGPHCVVGAGVTIGAGSELVAHAVVLGPTRLGKKNRVFPFVTLGAAPQDRSFAGEASELVIGDENIFREQVTVHRGTAKGGGATRIGSRCLVMVGAHIAHDCQLLDQIVLTNLATLGGHVVVESHVVCAGHVAVAPFARLGRGCFVAGGAMVERDVPPFVIAAGDRARVRALNKVGLKRMDVAADAVRALESAFEMLFRSREPRCHALESVRAELGAVAEVQELIAFLRASAERRSKKS